MGALWVATSPETLNASRHISIPWLRFVFKGMFGTLVSGRVKETSGPIIGAKWKIVNEVVPLKFSVGLHTFITTVFVVPLAHTE